MSLDAALAGLDLDNLPGDWADQGLCSQTDPDLFFPEKGDGRGGLAARKVCRSCPVTAECLDHALTTGEKHGVWGGLTPGQRRDMTRKAS